MHASSYMVGDNGGVGTGRKHTDQTQYVVM